jgi:hypothetical protein
MIRNWLRKAASRVPLRPKFVVVSFDLRSQSGHFFNELLGYKSAADAIGLALKILAPRTVDPRLTTSFAATAILDPLPFLARVDPDKIASQLDAFLDAPRRLDYLWAAIEAEGLSEIRAILFPYPNPALIRATGLWLARRSDIVVPRYFSGSPDPSATL